MTDLAWMKTYIGTEAALTGHLTPEEFGCYERLRRHYWQHGSLPDDDSRLARITGLSVERWGEVRPAVADLFDDGWRLPRLDEERGSAAQKRVRAIERSQKAAEARWGRKPTDATSNASSTARRNATSNASRMLDAMPEAMLEQCPSASDEVRYEERLAPTRTHARDLQPSEFPIDPFPTLDEAHTFLTRNGVPENELSGFAAKLQGERLYPADLARFRRPAA